LENIRWLQKNWSDNSVSCTVYYKKEEIPEIRKYLEKYYRDNFKSLSFLLHQDHGFMQAPYEEVTKEQYDELVSKTRLITRIDSLEFDETDVDCSSGACPVR
jgi:ribonucleoside-triphosphate reductase